MDSHHEAGTMDLNERKMTDWAKEPKLSDLKNDLEQARPFQQEHITRVDTWLDNLHVRGSAAIPKVEGKSSIQPKLIRKQAEWRYSSLSEPFLSAEKLFTVSPVSWNDKKAAEQNELLLNWQFMTQIDTVKLIDDLTHTLTDEGTVILEAGWERETEMVKETAPVYEYYAVQDEAAMAQLQEAMALKQTDPAEFEALPPDLQESVNYSIESGSPVVAVMVGTEEIETEKVIRNRPTVSVLKVHNFIADATCKGDLSKAMFASYSYEVTKAKLEKDSRYKNLDQVRWGSAGVTNPHFVGDTTQRITFNDASRQKGELTVYYGLYDTGGDDILRPIVAAWIGETLVRLEENPFPDQDFPYAVIPYMPITDSFYGEPDGELLADNQKIMGAVTRGIVDSLARTASGQRGMAKGMLDVTNQRRFESGQDYFFNPNMPIQNGIVTHTYDNLSASAFQMIQNQSIEAESLTGVKMFDDGLNSNSLGPVAAGIKGALDAANRREAAILRRIRGGLARIGAKIIAMNQQFLSDEEVVRVTEEKYVKIRRDELAGKFDTMIDVSTPGEDEAKANRLEYMLQTMGPKTDFEVTRMILVEIARLRRMPHLKYHLQNYQPQPDPGAQREQELRIQELEAKVAKAQAEAEEAMSRARLNLAKADDVQAARDQKDLDYVEQETGTNHARELEKQGAQARANENLEYTKKLLDLRTPQQ